MKGSIMGKLTNLKFIVTVLAMACVQVSVMADKIDSNVYSVLISLAVGGYMALEWKQEGTKV